MKVFVATARTQGLRSTDYFTCIEGELVHFGHSCQRSRDPERVCACGHAFAGLSSQRGCTTAEVRELDMSRQEFVETLHASLADGGRDPRDAVDHADRIIRLAAAWPPGIVLERHLGGVVARL